MPATRALTYQLSPPASPVCVRGNPPRPCPPANRRYGCAAANNDRLFNSAKGNPPALPGDPQRFDRYRGRDLFPSPFQGEGEGGGAMPMRVSVVTQSTPRPPFPLKGGRRDVCRLQAAHGVPRAL